MNRSEHRGMPRYLAWLVFAGLLLPLIAACGGSSSSTPAPTTANSGGQATSTETSSPSGTATSAATTAPSEGSGEVLHIHQPTYPDVVDPQKSSFVNEIAILSLNYEGLTKLNDKLETVPGAAETWDYNDDATEITFHLRDGLKYSDGSPLTAENFRYAVERTCDPKTAGQYQSILFEIKGCEDFANTKPDDAAAYDAAKKAVAATVKDDNTLVLELTHSAPYFHTVASLWVFYPAKQELVEQGGDNWWQDAKYQLGNGPFQVTQIDEDQMVSFKANENYWGGKPKLGGIELIYQKDSSVALEAYKSGQLDIMSPDPSQLPAIASDAELSKQLVQFASASSYNLSMNLTKEPFTDKKVREAFAYAFDRQTYCEQVRNGDCVPSLSWIPQGVPGAIETDKYAFDPAKAKQALADSSYGGADKLPEIHYYYSSDDPSNQPRAEWIAGQFRDVLGVQVKLEPTDGKTLVAMRKDPKTYPDLFIGGWIQDYPDPQNWLSVYWTCDATFAKRFSYCNQDFDAVVAKGDAELDPSQRMPFYEQAGQILVDDVPGPFIYNLKYIYLVKPSVTGYSPTPSDSSYPGEWGSTLTLDVTH